MRGSVKYPKVKELPSEERRKLGENIVIDTLSFNLEIGYSLPKIHCIESYIKDENEQK